MPHFNGVRKVLGVDHGATPDELKKAYRDLSRKFHPDLNSAPEAEVQMKKITTAYEVLTDPEKSEAFLAEQKEKRRAEIREMEKRKEATRKKVKRKKK